MSLMAELGEGPPPKESGPPGNQPTHNRFQPPSLVCMHASLCIMTGTEENLSDSDLDTCYYYKTEI